jgi:hypothetical protein
VVLELCQARIHAMLIDPYEDSLHDLEPCPEKMAAAKAMQQRSVPEILSAALKSRDHNVLSAMMGVSSSSRFTLLSASACPFTLCLLPLFPGASCCCGCVGCWLTSIPDNGRLR